MLRFKLIMSDILSEVTGFSAQDPALLVVRSERHRTDVDADARWTAIRLLHFAH